MNKDEKYQYLQNGGMLIRKGKDKAGKPIIKARTKDKDWHTLNDSYVNEEHRDLAFKQFILLPKIAED